MIPVELRVDNSSAIELAKNLAFHSITKHIDVRYHYIRMIVEKKWINDVLFSCVVKSQRRWSNKIYKTELTKIRYKNQVLCKYRVDP